MLFFPAFFWDQHCWKMTFLKQFLAIFGSKMLIFQKYWLQKNVEKNEIVWNLGITLVDDQNQFYLSFGWFTQKFSLFWEYFFKKMSEKLELLRQVDLLGPNFNFLGSKTMKIKKQIAWKFRRNSKNLGSSPRKILGQFKHRKILRNHKKPLIFVFFRFFFETQIFQPLYVWVWLEIKKMKNVSKTFAKTFFNFILT